VSGWKTRAADSSLVGWGSRFGRALGPGGWTLSDIRSFRFFYGDDVQRQRSKARRPGAFRQARGRQTGQGANGGRADPQTGRAKRNCRIRNLRRKPFTGGRGYKGGVRQTIGKWSRNRGGGGERVNSEQRKKEGTSNPLPF